MVGVTLAVGKGMVLANPLLEAGLLTGFGDNHSRP